MHATPVAAVRSALWLPIFDGLADPRTVAGLAAEAESAGWDGVFVWDHIRWREPVAEVADPWITLAAIATATESLRLGPMVTPLGRRRPAKVARETATLDQLSGGRLTLGVGLGSDRFAGEYSRTGEEVRDPVRARLLDETLEILTAAWSGEVVEHRGEHHTVDGVRFLPRPVQQPGVPVWVATLGGSPKPLRRAARHDGIFPVNLEHPDRLAELLGDVDTHRQAIGADGPYDVAAEITPDTDPAPYVAAGATWLLMAFEPESIDVDQVRAIARNGPPTR